MVPSTERSKTLYPLQNPGKDHEVTAVRRFSDGKYNINNQFGGTLYQHIGKDTATELMEYVDKLNLMHGGEGTQGFILPQTARSVSSAFRTACIFWMHQSVIWEQISTMWCF